MKSAFEAVYDFRLSRQVRARSRFNSAYLFRIAGLYCGEARR
jgi:hypothetical protein